MPVTPAAIFFFFALQAGLYILPIASLIIGRKIFPRNRWLTAMLAIVGFSPFIYFGYLVVTERVIAPAERRAEVASWPRKAVTPSNRPKVLVSEMDWWVAKALVDVGAFEKGYGRASEEWYLYERRPGAACPPTKDKWQRVDNADKPLKDTSCITAAKLTGDPQFPEPHLRLAGTPRSLPPNVIIFANHMLELRWSPNMGGDLAAYWEHAHFRVPDFPPMLLGFKGFARTHYSPEPYQSRPDPRKFVLDAIEVQ